MFIPAIEGAIAPTASPAFYTLPAATSNAPQPPSEPIRHMVFGSLLAVRATIRHLHKLRYAEANDWSQPMPTGRPNEVMAILTKRVSLG